jgi:hypothetical protein
MSSDQACAQRRRSAISLSVSPYAATQRFQLSQCENRSVWSVLRRPVECLLADIDFALLAEFWISDHEPSG